MRVCVTLHASANFLPVYCFILSDDLESVRAGMKIRDINTIEAGTVQKEGKK